MERNRKIKLAKTITTISLVGALGGGAICGASLLSSPAQPDNLTNKLVSTGMFLDDSEFNKHLEMKITEVYNNLREGKITSEEFSKQYDYLNSIDYAHAYARTSHDPKIKKAVTDYDKQVADFNAKTKSRDTAYTIGAVTASVLGTTALASGLTAKTMREDDEYNQKLDEGMEN